MKIYFILRSQESAAAGHIIQPRLCTAQLRCGVPGPFLVQANNLLQEFLQVLRCNEREKGSVGLKPGGAFSVLLRHLTRKYIPMLAGNTISRMTFPRPRPIFQAA